ncbi:MAG: chorismate synthase, partial [Lachnospiraceae bacterium]|nr:chorismate synthase [Candidatus Equihabitans merdae]
PVTNHAGGTLGGMSSGADLVTRVAFKPTPSIAQPQETVTKQGQDTTIEIKGRHDVCIVPRAAVVTEAMMALVLADHALRNMTARLDNVVAFYNK